MTAADRPVLVARRGSRPRTTPRTPHDQIDQVSPAAVAAELWARMSSLHIAVPRPVVDRALEQGWGEPHPAVALGIAPATSVMLFGPRDDQEPELVRNLVRTSHRYARGEEVPTWA